MPIQQRQHARDSQVATVALWYLRHRLSTDPVACMVVMVVRGASAGAEVMAVQSERTVSRLFLKAVFPSHLSVVQEVGAVTVTGATALPAATEEMEGTRLPAVTMDHRGIPVIREKPGVK